MKKVPTNQGVVNIVLIIIGVILSAILIGFFTYKGMGKPVSPGTGGANPPGSSTSAPVYPNIPTSTLPAGCTETSDFSTTTGEPCHPATSTTSCGLTVLTPSANQTVKNGTIISGKVNGCGWSAFEGQTGNVQAFKSNGVPVSGVMPLTASGDWMQTTVNFKVTLNITVKPTAGTTGFLLFRNEDASGSNPQTFKLPVKF
jgi:hypothetical protein